MDSRELERRRRVWAALSDLFLDTETRWFFPRVALVLVHSGYGVDELERIWRDEITPECVGNLWSVAGEWACLSLDEDALIRRAEGGGRLGRLLARWRGAPLPEQWRAVLHLRELLVATPDEERDGRVSAWEAFVHVYLEPVDRAPLLPEAQLERLQRSGLSAAALAAEWETVLRPRYRELLVGDEKASESVRALRVTALVSSTTASR